MRSYLFLIPLFVGIIVVSCRRSDADKVSVLPKEEERYLFDLGSQVDAMGLECGYERYEKCSDNMKKRISREVGYLSPEELIELGNYFHNQHIPYPITQHEKSPWIEEIVEKMKPFVVHQEYPYQVYTVEADFFNAFTIPGGNIYVTTGLLDMIDNIHQLAYVVGHEMGHNENDHTKELAKMYKYMKKLEKKGGLWDIAKALYTSFLSSTCGKADELECDISSIYLLEKAGYDPELALGGIEILRKISEPKSEGWWDQFMFALFSTHPWSEDRVRCVTGYVKGSKVTVKCEEIFDDQWGTVVTRTDPLNIREYPIRKSEKLHQIPKGETVQVLCDCVAQEFRPSEDYLFVEYRTENDEPYRGWVDKQYIRLHPKE